MKHALYLAIFAVFIAVNVSAQFSVDRFYTDGIKTLNLSMQSTTFDGDSVFVPYFHWLLDDDCYRPDSRSILGQEIRVSPDGLYEFVLTDDESVIVNSEANLSEPWIAWTSTSGDSSVQAVVSEISEDDPFGEMETIRSIGLQLLDSEMNLIDAEVNSYAFLFGSTSGLISFPSLLNFPEFEFTPTNEVFVYDLVTEESGQAYRGLTKFDIYDFQLGDQIHIEVGANDFGETTRNQYKHTILNRFDYPDDGSAVDSIVYTIEVQRWTYTGLIADVDPQPADTSIIDMIIRPDSLFDLPAGTALVEGMSFAIGDFTWLSTWEFGIIKNRIREGPVFGGNGEDEENCFSEILDWGCNGTAAQYFEGLGGPYYDCQVGTPLRDWRKLVYFSTEDEEWGEPLNVSDLRVDGSSIEVYPNPVQGEFRIGNDLHYSIQRVDVYDIHGRVLQSFSGNISTYDVSGLDSGIYLVVVNFDNGKLGSKKIVVE